MPKWSHSSLSQILSDPASYYLNHIEHISTIVEKPALYVGSAVHWGIEHNTEDLTEFFEGRNYGRDQLLSEAMCHGYLKHKDEIFNEILTNSDGTKLQLLDESHEVFITGKLASSKNLEVVHDFVGIIDLLLLTDKGFIVIDYKTSSSVPDWSTYMDQIYRYVFLLRCEFPEIPIVKIGIVNLRKTAIRQKKTENEAEFFNRMKLQYDLNVEDFVNYHEYPIESLDEELIANYIENMSKMVDAAKMIYDNKIWFINFGNAIGYYGKSEYYDIFYHTKDAHMLYKISDTFLEDYMSGEEVKADMIVQSRPCVPIDMLVLDYNNVMNHYDKYKDVVSSLDKHSSKSEIDTYLKSKYICDQKLLDVYYELNKIM